MNAFNKRYFVWISLIFLAFSRIAFFGNSLKYFVIFAVIMGAVYLFLHFRGKKSKNLNILFILTFCVALLGTVNTQMQLFNSESIIAKYSGVHTISGYISEVPSKEVYASEHIMRVESVDGKKTSFDIVIFADHKTELVRGDFIEFEAKMSALSEYDNFKYLNNSRKYEYPLMCEISENTEIISHEGCFKLNIALADLNDNLSYKLKYMIGKGGGELASALLLGNRDELSNSTLRDFRRAGVYHMLALSGMHVAILIGILDFVLKKCYAPKWIRIVLVVFSSSFYLVMTGFGASTCRAVLMLFAVYLSFILGKQGDSITFLFASVFLIVLFDPVAILDIGLLLSFFSTFGVLVAILIKQKVQFFSKEIDGVGILKLGFDLLKGLAFLSLTSLCVFVATLPILCFNFSEVSLATFFTNLFMGAICEIFMIMSILTLAFVGNAQIWSFLGEITNNFGNFMLDAVGKIADAKNIVLSLKYPGTEVLVVGLFAFSVLLLSLKLRRKWLIGVPVVAFAILMCINVIGYNSSIDGQVKSEFVSGDVLVLSSSDGVYLCDASDGRYKTLSEGYRLARENCHTELDGIILTHYHSRYVVSLRQIASNSKVHELYLPMPQNSDEGKILSAISRVLKDEGVKIYIYETNKQIDILSGELVVSRGAKVSGSSHPSIAFTYAYEGGRITVVERPYFDTYLESSGEFEKYIFDSDLLIFGSDGKKATNKFEIFSSLKKGSEVCFTDYSMLELSDFERYMSEISVRFDVEYKKYILK